jgi:hypothetical protein
MPAAIMAGISQDESHDREPPGDCRVPCIALLAGSRDGCWEREKKEEVGQRWAIKEPIRSAAAELCLHPPHSMENSAMQLSNHDHRK